MIKLCTKTVVLIYSERINESILDLEDYVYSKKISPESQELFDLAKESYEEFYNMVRNELKEKEE